jgi:hypothetical protein
MKTLVAVAHPDDREVILNHAAADYAVVATDGEAGIDMTGRCLCPR